MKTLGSKRNRMITGINVTPLVDVMLVLLVIFMVTATYIVRSSIGMKLPKASAGDNMSRSPLVLGVNAQGEYLIDDKPATEEEIAEHIRSYLEKNPDVEAVINGDRSVEYGKVMNLINLAKKNGVRNFAAAVENRQEP